MTTTLLSALLLLFVSPSPSCSFAGDRRIARHSTCTSRRRAMDLHMSLKPAALPLLDSGKALARSGELLIETTSQLDLYGGGLSAAGANVRNAGDCVAQAAASCRFKTAAELVCDELREGATCLTEACDHLKRAVEEAQADKDEGLESNIGSMIQSMSKSGLSLESAGAGILQRRPVSDIGTGLFECGLALEDLAVAIRNIAPDVKEASESCQRMTFASEKMREAGDNLRGTTPEKKPKGKGWIKG